MSHEKDREHPQPHPPRQPPPPASKTTPDRKYCEHPTPAREPVDPKPHPSRRLTARPA